MKKLEYNLDRTILICATPETVFSYFTDSARWAKWWGQGSTIDARVGGKMLICQGGGSHALGEVLEVVPNERIVFTYGYASGTPIGPGESVVTIRLERNQLGTRLVLTHEFSDEAARNEHVQGWRFQLSVFANVVADEAHANAADLADAWFAAWSITDGKARDTELQRIASPSICFRDRFSALDGIAELKAHVEAAQRFMPGVNMHRTGAARHCQGSVLADWVAETGDGKEVMSGTNLFVLGPDGRIDSATGFAREAAAH